MGGVSIHDILEKHVSVKGKVIYVLISKEGSTVEAKEYRCPCLAASTPFDTMQGDALVAPGAYHPVSANLFANPQQAKTLI